MTSPPVSIPDALPEDEEGIIFVASPTGDQDNDDEPGLIDEPETLQEGPVRHDNPQSQRREHPHRDFNQRGPSRDAKHPVHLRQHKRYGHRRDHRDEAQIRELARRCAILEESVLVTREALEIERRVAIRQENELRSLLAQTEERAAKWDASEAFGGATGEPDGEEIIMAFHQLNGGVLDLSLTITRGLHPDDLGVALHPASIEIFLQRNIKTHLFLRPMLTLAATAGVTVQDALVPLCQCIMHSFLVEFIFWPFFPGLVGEQNEYFYNLRGRIYAQESQERAGRWRAITYRAAASARDDPALAAHIATQFFTLLADLLRAVLPPGNFYAAELFPNLIGRTADIVLSAIRWQDTARMVYTSCDYEVFFPVPEMQVLDDEMQAVELPTRARDAMGMEEGARGEVVLLPITLGLRATRGRGVVSTKATCTVISKASVLAVAPARVG
ncbi:hypothetical protein EXIGLDRAFT_758994 [Exidia glandulosa HHB12029]|uniref:Uncharacterized protein n=1 Tax=Exidia glandulosa HHB12029 TaxID=1314781 RepID=A0A165QI57_EXIGL|nr:hypothetical protein EXIGLDRAFT_758994 [Exidia glandulosa HHB12029]